MSAHELDKDSARHVPANMLGRLHDDEDLRKLHQMLLKKKPQAPIGAALDAQRGEADEREA